MPVQNKRSKKDISKKKRGENKRILAVLVPVPVYFMTYRRFHERRRDNKKFTFLKLVNTGMG